MAPRRLGPRPLPLHLTAAALTWTASLGALPLLKQGSCALKGDLGARAAKLREAIAASEAEDFAEILGTQARRRALALLDGILAYRRHPYLRDLPPAPAIWSQGAARLLDYGALPGGKKPKTEIPVLVVPSLVNRAYILDLDRETSLLRWLAGRGLRPYLLDWGRAGPAERGFTLTDYIAGYLESALDAMRAAQPHGKRPIVAGYCMGGLLALALALRRQAALAGLVLLATPWDFHADPDHNASAAVASAAALSPALDSLGVMPMDAIQALFATLDPLLVARKFIKFSRLDPTGRKARLFVALEDWINDGVPLSAPVARECLMGWYGENTPAAGHWRVAGRAVDPGGWTCRACKSRSNSGPRKRSDNLIVAE